MKHTFVTSKSELCKCSEMTTTTTSRCPMDNPMDSDRQSMIIKYDKKRNLK